MAKSVSFWLDNNPPPDVRVLDADSLRETWRNSRNSLLGVMAAHEMMRRLDAKILTVEPYPQNERGNA
jgi:hypothetical protein